MTIVRKRQANGIMVPIISICCLITAIVLFVAELLAYSQQSEQLPANVTIAGINVGRLSPVQAATRIQQAYSTPLTLMFHDAPILLDPKSSVSVWTQMQ